MVFDELPGGPPAARIKLAEKAADSLRRQILFGEFKNGESLPSEAELMARFRISRPTLREAIRILEAKGLVVVLRGKHGGAAVRHPTPQIATTTASDFLQIEGATLLDLQRARSMIEPELIRNLAGRVSRQDLAPLRAILAEATEKARAQSVAAYVGCMTRFHTALIAMLGNRVLDLVVTTLHGIYEPLVAAIAETGQLGSEGTFETDIAGQEQLVSLMEQGRFDEAADHCRANLARIARSMEDNGASVMLIGSQSGNVLAEGAEPAPHIR